MEEIIIKITGDAKDLDSTIDQLEKLGKVDKQNSESFKKTNTVYKEQAGIVNDLKKKIEELTIKRDKSQNPNMIVRYNQLLGESKKKLAELTNETKKTTQETSSLSKALGSIGGVLAGAFTIGALVSFGKNVINVTAEFQKLGAVLTNTLGSQGKAERALNMIQNFAAETPFSVQELTDSFVKLANQGFTPTRNELRQLGDLASSMGKGFDQLTEAIIDAQTGEFERLKEFGIRAQKEGDKVSFTFKGVKTQVDFTNESIRNYILGLGDLAGVSGSMDAISQTLTGRISNLGDAFDKLFNVIGSKSDSVIGGAISLMSELVGNIADALTDIDTLIKREQTDSITKFIEENRKGLKSYLKAIEEDGGDVLKALENDAAIQITILQDNLDKAQAALDSFDKENEAGLFGTGFAEGFFKLTDAQEQQRTAILSQKILLEEQIKALRELYIDEWNKINESQQKGAEKTEITINSLKKKIDELTKQRDSTAESDRNKILRLNKEIEKTQELVKELENLGKADKKLNEERFNNEKKTGNFLDADRDERDKKENDRRIEQMKKTVAINEADQANKKKAKEKNDEERKAEREAATQFAFETINTITNALQDASRVRAENELAALDQSTENQLSALDKRLEAGLISENAAEVQREQIKKRAADKEKAIKLKQAQTEKAFALFQIGISTAQAIVKQLAVTPLPTGAPLVALVAAAGAVQAAIVASKPIPKFGKGGMINGRSHANGGVDINAEGGEFVMRKEVVKGNEKFFEALNRGNFRYQRPGKSLKEARESNMIDAIVGSMGGDFTDRNIVGAINKMSSRMDNSEKIAKKLAKELRRNPDHNRYAV